MGEAGFLRGEVRRALLRADFDGLARDGVASSLGTVPIARRDDDRRGEYRTRCLCPEAHDRFAGQVAPRPPRERYLRVRGGVC